MWNHIVRIFRSRKHIEREIDPDEVLLDAFNLPAFDTSQFEGRVERSISGRVPLFVGVVFTLVFIVFAVQAWSLQIARGSELSLLSEQNRLDHEILFAERGVLYDRRGEELAWNESVEGEEETSYARRKYTLRPGFAHVLGFLGYPERDIHGNWWRTEYVGKSGVEKSLSATLAGENGVRIVEVDALGNVQSKNTISDARDGESITLSIDAALQENLFAAINNGAQRAGFVGGAGIVMDVHTGEVLALVSNPEFSSEVLTEGVEQDVINSYNTDAREPFLNRAISGEYTPGSIVKPYVAAAALTERIISPTKQILSSGELRIPNPYFPGRYSIFRDWKAHGWVNVKDALALSSNQYFYTVGGGFSDQEGLGIARLVKYAHAFGLGKETGINLGTESLGVVPTPEWKEEVFGTDDPWLIGNTYHTSIGQFGFLMTPIQAVRYAASVANGGTLLTPHLVKGESVERQHTGVSDETLSIVRDGMRRGVAEGGTAASLNVAGVSVAAKTGTAQLGRNNEYMNSWVIGFWPARDPQFAFATVLEKAPAGTLAGAAPAMRGFFESLTLTESTYAKGEYPTGE